MATQPPVRVQTNAEMPADNVLRYRSGLKGFICLPTHFTEAPYGWGEPYYDTNGNPINGGLGTPSDATLTNSPYVIARIKGNAISGLKRKTEHEGVPQNIDSKQAYGHRDAWTGTANSASWYLDFTGAEYANLAFFNGLCYFREVTGPDFSRYTILGAWLYQGVKVVVTQHNQSGVVNLYAGMTQKITSSSVFAPQDYLTASFTPTRSADENPNYGSNWERAFISKSGANAVVIARKEIVRISLSLAEDGTLTASFSEELQDRPEDITETRTFSHTPAGANGSLTDSIGLINRRYQVGVIWSGETEQKVEIAVAYSATVSGDKSDGAGDGESHTDEDATLLYEAKLEYPGHSETLYKYHAIHSYSEDIDGKVEDDYWHEEREEWWYTQNTKEVGDHYIEIVDCRIEATADFGVMQKSIRRRVYTGDRDLDMTFAHPPGGVILPPIILSSSSYRNSQCETTYLKHEIWADGVLQKTYSPDPVTESKSDIAFWEAPFTFADNILPESYGAGSWGIPGDWYWTYAGFGLRLFPVGDTSNGYPLINHSVYPDGGIPNGGGSVAVGAADPPDSRMVLELSNNLNTFFARRGELSLFSNGLIKPMFQGYIQADASPFNDFVQASSPEPFEGFHYLTGQNAQEYFGLADFADNEFGIFLSSVL